MDDAYEAAIRDVHADAFDTRAWDVILRLAPRPTTPLSFAADYDAARVARLLRGDERLPAAAHPFELLVPLFPTSTAVATVAQVLLDAGDLAATKKVLAQATRTVPFAEPWMVYVEMLERGKASDAVVEKALRAAVKAVGMDAAAGPLWRRLIDVLDRRASADAAAAPALLEAAHTAVTMPVRGVEALWGRMVELRRAHGHDAAPSPALVEAHRLARETVDAEAAIGVPRLVFPVPRGARDAHAQHGSLWGRYRRLVRHRLGNPLCFADSTASDRFVDMAFKAQAAHLARVEAAYVDRAMFRAASGVRDDAAAVLAAGAAAVPPPCHLAALLSCELALGGTPPDDVAALWASAAALRKHVADGGAIDDTEFKRLRTALRAVGKGAAKNKVNEWEVYEAWAAVEMRVMADDTLVSDIVKHSVQLAEHAKTLLPSGGRDRVGHNMLALSDAVVGWCSARHEAATRNMLERTVQFADRSTLPRGAAAGAWRRLEQLEARYRGSRAADEVEQRRVQAAAERRVDGNTSVPRATAVAAQLPALLRLTAGRCVPLRADDARLWEVLADVEASAAPQDPEDLTTTAAARHMPVSIAPAAAVPDLTSWTLLKQFPANPQPPLPTDDQNTEELCAPRTMKTQSKFAVDASATARRIREVQRAAGTTGSRDAPAGRALGIRLPPQLTLLVETARQLPPLSRGAADVSTDWLLRQLEQPLGLQAPKTHRAE